MEFTYNGKKQVIKGIQKTTVEWVDSKKLSKGVDKYAQMFVVQVQSLIHNPHPRVNYRPLTLISLNSWLNTKISLRSLNNYHHKDPMITRLF